MATDEIPSESGWQKGDRGEERAKHLLRGHNCWYVPLSEIGENSAPLIYGPDGDALRLPDYLSLPGSRFIEVKNRDFARKWEEDGEVVDERLYIRKDRMEDYVEIARNLASVTICIYTEDSNRLFLADVLTLWGEECGEAEVQGESVYWYSIDHFRDGL